MFMYMFMSWAGDLAMLKAIGAFCGLVLLAVVFGAFFCPDPGG